MSLSQKKGKSFQNVIPLSLAFGHSVIDQPQPCRTGPQPRPTTLWNRPLQDRPTGQARGTRGSEQRSPSASASPLHSSWQSSERKTDDGDEKGREGHGALLFSFISGILYDSFLLSCILDVFQTINHKLRPLKKIQFSDF